MKLHQLTLEHWRGVENRTIVFSPQVTLVEGPNEVGKSTIIEALYLLLNLRDDSKRYEVKAVQPVGQDVGSRIELEFSFGGYRVVYAKRFNKNRETTLSVLQPQARQLSGREAHEHLTQLLEAAVDLSLWNALLVDQGAGVGQVALQDSASLSAALDASARVSANPASDNNASLFTAVQAEYETYFTLNKGNSKFGQLETDLAAAERALLDAQQSLQQVAQDVAEQEALARSVQEQEARIPAVQAAYQQHESALAGLTTLKNQLQVADQELKALLGQQKTLLAERQERTELERSIAKLEERHAQEEQHLSPLLDQLGQAKHELEHHQGAIDALQQQVQAAQVQAQLAADDAAQAQRLVQVSGAKDLLAEVARYNQRVQVLAQQQAQLLVDAPALEQLRAAQTAVDLALAKRDTAATSLKIESLADITLNLDGQPLQLTDAQVHEQVLAKQLQLELPNVVRITVEPSHSVAQLQEESTQSEARWQRLAVRYQVADLASAVATQAQRAAVDAELEQLKTKQAALLEKKSVAEVQEQLAALESQCVSYQQQRVAQPPAPGDLVTANIALQTSTEALAQSRAELEDARAALEIQRRGLDNLKSQHAGHQESQVGQAATLGHQQQRLVTLAAQKSTEQLDHELQRCQQQLGDVQGVHNNLAERWHAANAQQQQLLRDNAQAALKRAQAELSDKQQRLAILLDRLEQGKASGKYDTLEATEAHRRALAEQLAATNMRAAAARRLWITLNEFRTQARSAYVAPLKTAIESLGSIVFGSGFAVEVAPDWSITSRTLDGKTLPFAALSIGAQEQLALISRLAAAQITAPAEGVPLIVDDALGFSDPARLASMGAVIAAAGRQAQVILLTCTPGRFANVGNAQLVSLVGA